MINSIINGDCLEVMRGIPDKSIDMILCDLPYGTTACKWDKIIPFEPLWEQYKRLIKDNGAIVLTASQPFTSALVMSNIKMFKYEWIWQKGKATNPLLAKKQPLKQHESILVFNTSTYNYILQPLTESGTKRNNRAKNGKFKNKESVYGDMTKLEVIKYEGKSSGYPKSIIKFNSEANNQFKRQVYHPTQKPVALFEYLIKTYTNENETVLDNCSGSGTTAIACINTNRNYICIEKDKTYFDLSVERVNTHKQNLFNKAC